jgi:hypothetical protein
MHVLHCRKPQTSLNVNSIGTPKDAAILKSASTQHLWWHGCKLSRTTKKVICNFGFLKNNNKNSLFFSFNAHYHLSSLLAFCVVLCVCDISFQSLFSTFIIYPSSRSLGAQGLKFESSLQVVIFIYLFCFLVEHLHLCNDDHYHCHIPVLFLLSIIAMASSSTRIPNANAQATKTNVVYVVVRPIASYISNNSDVNGLVWNLSFIAMTTFLTKWSWWKQWRSSLFGGSLTKGPHPFGRSSR